MNRVERKDLGPDLSTGLSETPAHAPPVLAGSTRQPRSERAAEATPARRPVVRFADPPPEEQGLINGSGEGDDSIIEDQPRADGAASEASEGPDAKPRLPAGPARPFRRLLPQRAGPEERRETRLEELTATLGKRVEKLEREDEDVSEFVRDLSEYVERAGTLRGKLEEDARRIGELAAELEKGIADVEELRGRIQEEVSRVDKLL